MDVQHYTTEDQICLKDSSLSNTNRSRVLLNVEMSNVVVTDTHNHIKTTVAE